MRCREPVCIASRAALPPYDAGFRGYGLNKVQHAYHLAALGFTFLVRTGLWGTCGPVGGRWASCWR